jgi:hypothetical protein
MKKCLSALAEPLLWKIPLLAVIGAIGTISPAMAGESARKNSVGPAITLVGGLTGFGANARFGIADNVSVRPYVIFFSGTGASATAFGGDITYDYNFPKSDWTIYGGLRVGSTVISNGTQSAGFGGIVFNVGTDYQISDSLVLNANGNFGGLTLGGRFNF